MSKTMTIEEINTMLIEIAQDPEAGPDKFRALRMLSSMQSSTVALPEPLNPKDIIERLGRMMYASGIEISQMAFLKAFPRAQRSIFEVPKLLLSDASPDMYEQALKITSLKVFYRRFPSIKINGVPKGYPVGRGLPAQREWLRLAALKALVDEENQKRLGPQEVRGIVEDSGARETETLGSGTAKPGGTQDETAQDGRAPEQNLAGA